MSPDKLIFEHMDINLCLLDKLLLDLLVAQMDKKGPPQKLSLDERTARRESENFLFTLKNQNHG